MLRGVRLALGFELVEERDEIGMVFESVEIGILLHPVEIAVAEFDRLAEGAQGGGLAFHEGEAAGEIVVRGWIRRQEADEAAVHAQAVDDAAVFGVEAAEDFDHVRVRRVAFEDRLEEFDLELVIFGARHGDQLRRGQVPVSRSESQRALTCRRWERGVSPSFEETVLPYQLMNGALISKILSQSMQTTWAT